MASEVDIANRALSMLGEARITALSDNNKAGRAMNARFDLLRDAELAAYPWRFSINRVQLQSQLATNGTFDADSDWTKGTGWTISSGVASCDGTQVGDTELSQSITIFTESVYRITFDLTVTAGAVTYIGIGGTQNTTDISASASVSVDLTTVNATGDLLIAGNSTFVGTVDNVVVNEIPAWGYSLVYNRPSDDLQPRSIGGHYINHGAIGVMYESTGYTASESPYEIVEGRIHTNLSAPLDYEYHKQITDPTLFDPLFVEALASRLAADAAEELTQSNSKQQAALFTYRKALNVARRTSSIMRPPRRRGTGRWMLSRSTG